MPPVLPSSSGFEGFGFGVGFGNKSGASGKSSDGPSIHANGNTTQKLGEFPVYRNECIDRPVGVLIEIVISVPFIELYG